MVGTCRGVCLPFYSVVIRTLGTAGLKYKALLDSLRDQTIPPAEVLVVIPEGTRLPKERLGTEEFVRTGRGPVHQRACGMELAKSEFLLLCDDDVCFGEDFVEKLYRTHLKTGADIVVPRTQEVAGEPAPTLKTKIGELRDFFCGFCYVSKRPSPYSIRIWDTGGYIRNGRLETDRQYYAQSGPGTCAFLDHETAASLRLRDEFWLEEAGYALPDDQVMFFKAFRQGHRIAWCPEALLRHLDAGSGHPDRFTHMSYANSRNFTIFWHRFLYRPDTRVLRRLSLVCWLGFRVTNTCLYYAALLLLDPKRPRAEIAFFKGYRDAVRYLRTKAYRQLPTVEGRQVEPTGRPF